MTIYAFRVHFTKFSQSSKFLIYYQRFSKKKIKTILSLVIKYINGIIAIDVLIRKYKTTWFLY